MRQRDTLPLSNLQHAGLGVLAAALFALCTAATAGTIYKCTNPDGEVAYRDQPCDGEAAQDEVDAHRASSFGNAPSSDRAMSDALPDGSAPGTTPVKDCSNWAPPPWTVEVSLPPEPDLSAYPSNDAGEPVVAEGPEVELVAVTRRDPISVQSECTTMVDGCFQKDHDRRKSLDACFNSAPRCTSSRPWEESKPCCPDACWQQYANLRRQCVDPLSASTRVFFDDHCVPGVAALLGGQEPP
jgi:uncharacterized protein DUF4124